MLGKLAVLVLVVAQVYSQCVDKTNNVVDIADASGGNYNVVFNNAVGATYDSNSQPKCYQGEADLMLPGILGLISGTVTVNQGMEF